MLYPFGVTKLDEKTRSSRACCARSWGRLVMSSRNGDNVSSSAPFRDLVQLVDARGSNKVHRDQEDLVAQSAALSDVITFRYHAARETVRKGDGGNC
jgi:hypothetical protein